jgi:hypothetical protein
VTYDEATWREIAAVLRTDREMIHPINRAQVLLLLFYCYCYCYGSICGRK